MSSNSEYSADSPHFPEPTNSDERDNPSVQQVQSQAPSLFELYDDVRECCPEQPTADIDSSQHVVDYRGIGILRNMSVASSTSGEYSISSVSSLMSSSLDEGRRDNERIKELETRVDDMQAKFEKELSEKSDELKAKGSQLELVTQKLELALKEAAQEKREKEWYKQQSEEMQRKVDELQREKEKLCKDVEQLRSEVKRLEKEMGNKVERLAHDMDNVRNQNNGIQSSVDQMQRKMEQVTIQIPDNGKQSSLKSVQCVASQVAETFSRTLHDPTTTAAVSNLKMIDKSLDITNSGVGSSSTQDSASVADANNETPDES